MHRRIAVVGAGLTGCSAAYMLKRNGWDPVIHEVRDEVGGNTRTGLIHGVRYERCGPHIFHTNDTEIWEHVQPFVRYYRHFVKSRTKYGDLCWPPQLFEIRRLPIWSQVEKELEARPALPQPDVSFEEYVIAMMGRTLYETFIEGYTRKQWQKDPSELSAVFAPRRIDLRDDPRDTYLFRDKYQGWLNAGDYIDQLLTPGIEISLGSGICADNLPDADGYIVTAALDQFLHADPLPWRSLSFTHVYLSQQHLFQTAPVVNLPTMEHEATRITESPWMTRFSGNGTVVTYEFPLDGGFPSYPIADAQNLNRVRQMELEAELTALLPNAIPAGRLGRYVYIDMDQAIRQGWNAANAIMRKLA